MTNRDFEIKIKEYSDAIEKLGEDPSDDSIVAALVDLEWPEKSARVMLVLANSYGCFMLSNALALANALGIEDGDLKH